MKKDITLKDPKTTALGKFILLLLKRTYTGRLIVQETKLKLQDEKTEAIILTHRAKGDAKYWHDVANRLQNQLEVSNKYLDENTELLKTQHNKIIILELTIDRLKKYDKNVTHV